MYRAALVLACLAVASVASKGGEWGLEPALRKRPWPVGAWGLCPAILWMAHHQKRHGPLGLEFLSRPKVGQGGEQVHRRRVS